MGTLRFLQENAPWLAAGVLLTFLSSFGQTFFISVFAGEIRETFGLSHGEWGGIYTLGTSAAAIASRIERGRTRKAASAASSRTTVGWRMLSTRRRPTRA